MSSAWSLRRLPSVAITITDVVYSMKLATVAGQKSKDELWREFFSDPSQWLDHRKDKVNPRYPDFKHRKTGVPLWIGKRIPQWVEAEFDAMRPGSVPRSPFYWNCWLAGRVKSDQAFEALKLFRQMQAEGVMPDSFTFVMICNACASFGALEEGRHVHALVIQSGCESDVFVGSSLVDMYAKCGSVDDAWKVFHTMAIRDVVSWTAMLAGYVKSEQGQRALELYQQMQAEGVKANVATFVVVLNACAASGALEEGRSVHKQVIDRGCEPDLRIGNCLVDMYAKCGCIGDAWAVFHSMPIRNVVSWTTLLAGCVKLEQGNAALKLFEQMQVEGVKANTVTFTVVLNACASLRYLDEGKNIHAQVIQTGCQSDVFVGSALVDMYAKCGSIDDAWIVFSSMPYRNEVSWNAMIAGSVRCEQLHKALELYQLMQAEGVKPNTITFVVVLNACASSGALEDGKRVHAQAIQSRVESNLRVGNCLVDMYGKCASVNDAWRVFTCMPTRDVVTWNALLTGYVIDEQFQRALELYQLMLAEGVAPNTVTFLAVLSACAILGALEDGRRIHALIIQTGCDSDVYVGSTLVDMYAKCGSVGDAWTVFYSLPFRCVVSCNAMLGGLAMHGHGEEALKLFENMHWDGGEVDEVTFVCLLSACSHGGLVEEGLRYFSSMSLFCGITPTLKHYACLVDLLARAGRLREAEDIVRAFSCEQINDENKVAWTTLLGACRNHRWVTMGERL